MTTQTVTPDETAEQQAEDKIREYYRKQWENTPSKATGGAERRQDVFDDAFMARFLFGVFLVLGVVAIACSLMDSHNRELGRQVQEIERAGE